MKSCISKIREGDSLLFADGRKLKASVQFSNEIVYFENERGVPEGWFTCRFLPGGTHELTGIIKAKKESAT